VCVDNPNAYALLIQKPYHTAIEKAQIEAAIDSDAEIEGPWVPSLDPSYDITVRRLTSDDGEQSNACSEGTIKALENAIRVDPEDVKLIIGLAEVHECRGDFKAASGVYDIALKRFQGMPQPLNRDDDMDDFWFVSYRLAVTSSMETDHCKEKLLIDAYELRPDRREPLNYLAVVARDQNRPYSALMYATQVRFFSIFWCFPLIFQWYPLSGLNDQRSCGQETLSRARSRVI
jgi:hypothetical protein